MTEPKEPMTPHYSAKAKNILETLYGGFFGFWVVKRRVTMLLMAIILIIGGYSLATIPKESTPDIEFGVISITTPYIGVNPIDIDQLITQKIEKEVDEIDGIKKITSSSVLGISSVFLELETDVETSDVLVDVNDAVDKVLLPEDANDPIVTAISTENTVMFDVVLFADKELYSLDYLREKANRLKNELEWVGSITDINISLGGNTVNNDGDTGGGSELSYDLNVLVTQEKLEILWLSIFQITQAIRDHNLNQPIGNFEVGSKSYDFRIQAELEDVQELLDVPLPVQGPILTLGDIATIERDYNDDTLVGNGSYGESGFVFVSMTFNKEKGKSIFQASAQAKEDFENMLALEEFSWLRHEYLSDLSEVIIEDYTSLAKNGGTTIFLVFLCMFLFIGFKESIIASITIPLAFLITFFVLKQLGLSLNFLTNFSLIITFGIAIDVTIVIVEWAHEKLRLGFNPKEAVLLAVRDYKLPLIAGTSTTLAAFIPMLNLPGVTGKFLAYIPITIFSTLLAALFLALTINSALYYKFSKKVNYYTSDKEDEEFMPDDELLLLKEQRKTKEAHSEDTLNLRERWLLKTSRKYEDVLWRFLKTPKNRLLVIVLPVVALILSFLLPIGFTFFPSGDNPFISVSVRADKGIHSEFIAQHAPKAESILSSIPEVKMYRYTINKNIMSIGVELFSKDVRDRRGLRDSFKVEEEIIERLGFLQSFGLKLETNVQRGGPPEIKPVGVKLVADSTDDLPVLIEVAKEFEQQLLSLTWTRNISLSTEDSPWQFVFYFDDEALALLGLAPRDLTTEIFARIQGLGAWSIKGKYYDHDIKVMYADYDDKVSPSQVENIVVNTRAWPIRVGDVMDYDFDIAIDSIQREDTKILIRAEADVEAGTRPDLAQAAFIDFVESYEYPDGISYEVGGENAENADLLAATAVAGLIALLLIYSILVLQFNSYSQPAIIMYSVIMGLLGANIGLYLTGNMYSMSFAIGFIALTGIVVNDAIVFIDRINKNLRKWMDKMRSVKEAGKARLHPIILTTITTVLGLSTVALEDEFFAGLAYTIMFGLFVGSTATLFAIPAIFIDQEKVSRFVLRSFVGLIGLMIVRNIFSMMLF